MAILVLSDLWNTRVLAYRMRSPGIGDAILVVRMRHMLCSRMCSIVHRVDTRPVVSTRDVRKLGAKSSRPVVGLFVELVVHVLTDHRVSGE